jgi:hypothetical protein
MVSVRKFIEIRITSFYPRCPIYDSNPKLLEYKTNGNHYVLVDFVFYFVPYFEILQ